VTIHSNFSTLIIVEIIAYICCFYLLFPIGSSLLSLLSGKSIQKWGDRQSDFACIITVYKEVDIAWPLVRSLLAQNYPHFHIYLVADNVSTMDIPIEDHRLTVLQTPAPLHSKVASVQYILTRMKQQHSHVAVFDPDNLVPRHFLVSLDKYHHAGYPAVQGKRIAKNMDSTYAALDAMGEYFYDFTVRKVPFSLGSSSVIAGSGMSVRRDLYEYAISLEMEELQRLGVVVAEDKALQLLLVNRGHRIAYAPDAIIFDEKVASFEQVSRQRSRWLNSYFRHSREVLKTFFSGLAKMDWNRLWFAVTTLMPPLFILVFASMFLLLIFLFLEPIVSLILGLSLAGFAGGFIAILFFNRAPEEVMQALPKVPVFIMGQISGLLKIQKANKDFLATSHKEIVEIEEIWEKRKHEFAHLDHLWGNKKWD
jgi:cellulose synthase/poly-beta-1,6-N-acetylglucosamine synthase-like glycosyltransferase